MFRALLKSGFTFMIVPRKTSRVLSLSVPHFASVGGGALVLLFLVLGGYGLYRSVVLQVELSELRTMKNKHLRQQVAVKKVSNRINEFKNQIDRLRELDYKLRLIADLDLEHPTPSLYGVGGALSTGSAGLGKNADVSQMDLLTMLNKDLVRLKEMADFQEESYNNLKAFLVDQKDLLQRSPYRWPLRGFISSKFGIRMDPFTGLPRRHVGIDIVAPKGSPIIAPADGIVTYSGVDTHLGSMLVIDHGYGLITRYGHNDSNLTREGLRVKRGEVIALVGSTGRSTGPHLHYEIRINDVPVDPLKYMLR